MKEEIVCICTQALFIYLDDNFGDYVFTKYNHCIRKEENPVDENCNYYDIYKNMDSGLRLCCDGEQCKVLEKTSDYVKLIDVENIDNPELSGIDTTFKLAIDEFKIATE